MYSEYTITQDLDDAKAMADHLKDYLLDDKLYGNVGGRFSNMPSLTIGALLMRLQRLDALSDRLTDRQKQELQETVQQFEHVRSEWTVRYEERMLREINSRLDAMRQFFEECEDNPRACAGIYRPEALRRTIIESLLIEMEARNIQQDSDLDRKLRGTDGRLRGVVHKTEFIWHPMLQEAYPADRYWWLYGEPVMPEENAR